MGKGGMYVKMGGEYTRKGGELYGVTSLVLVASSP
jgi:hypothetical protein